MTTERLPLPADPEGSGGRALSRPLLFTLIGVGAALVIALIVLTFVLVRGGSDPDPAAGGAGPSGSATTAPGSTLQPTGSATPTPGAPQPGEGGEADGSNDNAEADGTGDGNADDAPDGQSDDGGIDGAPISLLGISTITVSGPGGISLGQVCAPGNNAQAYGASQDKQPAVLTWTTTAAKKVTLDVNGTLVFNQPANGEHLFVFDCFSNTGSPNTWRFEVNAADASNAVKSAAVYANVEGTTGLKYE